MVYLCVCVQVPLLPERLHFQLFICVVGLAKMGERDRLDGTQWNKSAPGFYWPRSPVARGTLEMCNRHSKCTRKPLYDACLISWFFFFLNCRYTELWDWTSQRLRSSFLAQPSLPGIVWETCSSLGDLCLSPGMWINCTSKYWNLELVSTLKPFCFQSGHAWLWRYQVVVCASEIIGTLIIKIFLRHHTNKWINWSFQWQKKCRWSKFNWGWCDLEC